MTHKESLYPKDWMRIAEKDLKRVDRLLADNDVELAGHLRKSRILSLKEQMNK